jgi:hypothetical protein
MLKGCNQALASYGSNWIERVHSPARCAAAWSASVLRTSLRSSSKYSSVDAVLFAYASSAGTPGVGMDIPLFTTLFCTGQNTVQ